jgi:large repetitive protein
VEIIESKERNGTVVVDNGAPGNINLNHPTGIVVDAEGYFFIVDHGGHRIIRSGPSGSSCLVGCSGSNGTRADQFSSPRTLTFDTNGNMFVIDQNNNRIQRFALIENSCGE